MNQAIHSKILPATDTRDTRIKATAWRGSITVSVNDPRLSESDCMGYTDLHAEVARLLLDRFDREDSKRHGVEICKWRDSALITGCMKGETYVHVIMPASELVARYRDIHLKGKS